MSKKSYVDKYMYFNIPCFLRMIRTTTNAVITIPKIALKNPLANPSGKPLVVGKSLKIKKKIYFVEHGCPDGNKVHIEQKSSAILFDDVNEAWKPFGWIDSPKLAIVFITNKLLNSTLYVSGTIARTSTQQTDKQSKREVPFLTL